jgi:hypothetical protein
MTTTNTNGRGRKSLAEQIDRLDAILDGLADNLNEAVAMAAASSVKEVLTVAVEKAVHAALVEILSNPEVEKRLTAKAMEKVQPRLPITVRLGRMARSCWTWLADTAKGAWRKLVAVTVATASGVKRVACSMVTTASSKINQAREQAMRGVRIGWMLTCALAALAKRFRKQVAVAAGIGVLVGVVSYVGGREVASAGCGLAGFVGTLAKDAVARVRRSMPFRLDSDS